MESATGPGVLGDRSRLASLAASSSDSTRSIPNDSQEQLVASTTELESISADTGSLAAIFLIVNAALGAGLLNVPYVFDEAGGFWISLGLQMVPK